MSVAFVKEPNEEQVEGLPERDLGTDPNYVTVRGLEMLDKAIEAGQAQLEAAQSAGDKIAVAMIRRDLRYWRARRSTAEVVIPKEDSDVVQFGNAVTIRRRRSNPSLSDCRHRRSRPRGRADLLPVSAGAATCRQGRGETIRAGAGEAEIISILC